MLHVVVNAMVQLGSTPQTTTISPRSMQRPRQMLLACNQVLWPARTKFATALATKCPETPSRDLEGRRRVQCAALTFRGGRRLTAGFFSSGLDIDR
eukprot:SAG11_NODE_20901_length_436_cov_0.762611_1_plen_95_part_01